MRLGSLSEDARGVSETLGYIILVMVIVTGAGLVVYLGSGTMDLVRSDAASGQAETALLNLNSALTEVAQSSGQTQIEHTLGINPHAGGSMIVIDDSAELTVEVEGEANPIAQQQLNKIRYQDQENEFIYRAGAIFEVAPEEDIVAFPAIHLFENTGNSGKTLSITAMGISNESNVGRNTYISHADNSPVRSAPRSLDGENVTIRVSNIDHPDLWEDALARALLGERAEQEDSINEIDVSCGVDECTVVIDSEEADVGLLHVTQATLELQDP